MRLPEEDRKMLEEETSPECSFTMGQLAWAQVGKHPYWPCVVTLDLVEKRERKIRRFGKSRSILVHVQYFGDNCRHGWVSERSIIPFTGLDDFYKLAENAAKTKRGKNIVDHYSPKATMLGKWNTAVSEATVVLPLTNDERAVIFNPEEPKTLNQRYVEMTTHKKSKKREILSETEEPSAKRIKCEDDEQTTMALMPEDTEISTNGDEVNSNGIWPIFDLSLKSIKKENNKLITKTETLPMKRPVAKDPPMKEAKKRMGRRKMRDTDGDFSVYCMRIRDVIENMYPDATESEIMTQLENLWDCMDYYAQSKYSAVPEAVQKDLLRKPKQARLMYDTRSQESTTDDENTSTLTSESTYKSKKIVKDSPIRNGIKILCRGVPERVCRICEKPNDLIRCIGLCSSYIHLSCDAVGESSSSRGSNEAASINGTFLSEKTNNVDTSDRKNGEISEDTKFVCTECRGDVVPTCFICNRCDSEANPRCSLSYCGRHYHPVCLKAWPQSRWHESGLTCPSHTCHTCYSDNPEDLCLSSVDDLVRCTRCPSSYHSSPSCLPAGAEILSKNQIICPKHLEASKAPINATWCFTCKHNDRPFIHCDTCPKSFHSACLDKSKPNGGFICKDCENGKLPLYGEIIWAKLGAFRWWPSRICHPHEIPQNLKDIPHRSGEFCVMFLGANNYHWLDRGRVLPYHESDNKTTLKSGATNRDAAYAEALEAGDEALQIYKSEFAMPKNSVSKRIDDNEDLSEDVFIENNKESEYDETDKPDQEDKENADEYAENEGND